VDATSTIIRLGVQKIGTTISYHRGYLYFDTSSLPDNATVTEGTLSAYLTDDWRIIPGGIEIVLMHGVTGKPSTPLAVGDFNHNLYSSGGAPNATAYNAQTGELVFTLNATGRGWINVSGLTAFCLRTEHDVAPCNPIARTFFDICATEKGGGFRPRLNLTYGTKATVTTDAASGVGASSATGHGTIDSEGDGSPSEYGFIWNDDGSDPVDLASADNSQTSSNLSGGSFSASIGGLAAETTYNYRAYVTTEYGTTCGDAVEFTTDTAPAVLTIETHAASSVGSTTATLNGELVADGGESVTEHGFVWASGHDPMHGQTGAPTGADHYCELGTGSTGTFNHGATGMTAGSLYLFRAYGTTGGGTLYGGLRHFRLGSQTTGTFYGMTGDGYVRGEVSDVEGAGNICAAVAALNAGASMSTTGAIIELSASRGLVGSDKWDGVYDRGALYFNTSPIPAGAVISSATCSLFVIGKDGVDYAYFWEFSPYYPSSTGTTPTLATGDYDGNLIGFTKVGTMTGASLTPGQYNTVSLSTGVVSPGTLTKFIIQLDPECSASTTGSSFSFYSGDDATRRPKLEVAYSVEGGAPAYPQANIGDEWKGVDLILANIGDEWRPITEMQANIGDEWKGLTGA